MAGIVIMGGLSVLTGSVLLAGMRMAGLSLATRAAVDISLIIGGAAGTYGFSYIPAKDNRALVDVRSILQLAGVICVGAGTVALFEGGAVSMLELIASSLFKLISMASSKVAS